MSTMEINIGDVSIAYRVEGNADKPWLILSNSLATDHRMWAPQIPVLQENFRLLRYDTRGHGSSTASKAPYSFADLTGDVIGLMDQLGIRSASFMGLSLGGMTALGLALDHADRIDRIICCDARADAPEIYRKMWPANIERARNEGMAALVEPTMERWFTADFRADTDRQQVLLETGNMIASTAVEGYAGCASALMTLDYLPRLGDISLPSLFVVGEHDPAAPADVMKNMADATRGSAFEVIRESAHLSNLEKPEAFNKAIMGWLNADT
jgi:3-oxoadipate enol-lactonase